MEHLFEYESKDIEDLFKDLASLGMGKGRVIIEIEEKSDTPENPFKYRLKFPKLDVGVADVKNEDIIWCFLRGFFDIEFESIENKSVISYISRSIRERFHYMAQRYVERGDETDIINFMKILFRSKDYGIYLKIRLIIDLEEILYLEK